MGRSEESSVVDYGPQEFRAPAPWGSPLAAKEVEPIGQRPRSALKIRLDILEVVRDEGPSKPAKIIRSANLAHSRVVKCLRELASQGLLTEILDGGTSYALSAKGLEFVNQVKQVEAFLAGFGFGI
jgi:predicted transcriptional regulator